jgi:hypothetical protein
MRKMRLGDIFPQGTQYGGRTLKDVMHMDIAHVQVGVRRGSFALAPDAQAMYDSMEKEGFKQKPSQELSTEQEPPQKTGTGQGGTGVDSTVFAYEDHTAEHGLEDGDVEQGEG